MSTLGDKLKHELRELIPVIVFFFGTFQLLALTQALMLKKFGIHVSTFLTVTVMALVVAKVVLITDHFPLLGAEVEALGERTRGGRALVALDEVQRVPELVNVVQDLIDRKVARFILTGSSARKLRRGGGVNLLPGRLVPLRLDPLSLSERVPPTIEEALVYGSLPGIALAGDDAAREEDLRAYTTLYLEEEVRAEALVRNLGMFARFLQLAALEAGGISHFRGIAQELGVSHTTVAGYYEILEDCLIAERIEALSQSRTRKKLTKSPRYLFFDLGVRRAAADEGPRQPVRVLGAIFEQVCRAGTAACDTAGQGQCRAQVLARSRRTRGGLGGGDGRPLVAGGSKVERCADRTGRTASPNIPVRVF